MSVKGIRPIINSKDCRKSPWNIPCFISTLPKFCFFPERHDILQKILNIIACFEHGKAIHDPGIRYISHALRQSIEHIARFFLLIIVSFRTILLMKIKPLVYQATFLHPFCSSVKTPLSSSDSYILSEIIPINVSHIFGRHVMNRWLIGIVLLLRSF